MEKKGRDAILEPKQRRGLATSRHQISSANNRSDWSGFGVAMGRLLVGKRTLKFWFFSCQLRSQRNGVFLPASSAQWKRNCIDPFHLLLPYVSSYLSCKWKWDPKLQQMGPCHWVQMFSAPCPECTRPIKLTLTPSADRTDISFTNPPLKQFVLSRGLGNNWMSARGKYEVMVSKHLDRARFSGTTAWGAPPLT